MAANERAYLEGTHDYELSRVPMSLRRGLYSVVAVIYCWVINPAPALTGASIADKLYLNQALLAIILGSIVVGAYSIPVGLAGTREGYSTALLARLAFGERGSDLIAAIVGFANLIFYGVVIGIFVASLESLLGLEPKTLMVWGGIVFACVMASSAYFGYRGLDILSKVTMPIMLVLFSYAAIRAVVSGGGWAALAAMAPKETIPLSKGISATIGIFIVGATLTPDITRYARSAAHSVWGSILGFALGLGLITSLGAIGAKGAGTGDLVLILVNAGLKWIGLFLLLISSWAAGDNNVYSADLAMSKLFRRPAHYFTIITVIVGAVTAATGIYYNLLAYLGIIALTIPPVGGIIAVDYFLIRKRHLVKDPLGTEPRLLKVNWVAILAWVVAVVVDYLTAVVGHFGVSGLNGLIVGTVVFYVGSLATGQHLQLREV